MSRATEKNNCSDETDVAGAAKYRLDKPDKNGNLVSFVRQNSNGSESKKKVQ
jgi:hypothetical protein